MQTSTHISRESDSWRASAAAWRVILLGGLLAGIGDITQAMVVFGLRGASPERVLQSVALGLLGRSAFDGGWKTALAGLGLHFLIAIIWATVYYAASRVVRIMMTQPVLSGLLYGEIVFLFMYLVVLPLSQVHRDPHASLFTVPLILTGWIGHPLLVGLPIALAVRRGETRAQA